MGKEQDIEREHTHSERERQRKIKMFFISFFFVWLENSIHNKEFIMSFIDYTTIFLAKFITNCEKKTL